MDRRSNFVESMTAGLRAGLSQGVRAFADLVMPPACMACGEPVTHAPGLCARCWSALPALGDALCDQCGVPLPIEWQTESHCLQCLHTPPPFAHARAPYLYDATARSLVLGLKHGREAWAPMLAAAMARTAPDWIGPDRLLVPVPLHRWRLASRGYNQALLLAAALRRTGGAPLARDWLQRIRNTPSSRGLNQRQRQRNVAGAFRLRPETAARVQGAQVTLVDDVLTTGATAAACARVLLAAGAAEVNILTYARVATAADATYLTIDPVWSDHGQS